ncbi:MAG: TVP38/TMEM64 family protein [Deltaproteobacteria bacterium]|nr:TVP38/TMEM64 family protein [Deltaproteobacteria bacterium]
MKTRKILILLVFTGVVAAFYFLDLGKYLTLESLKANRAWLSDLRLSHTVLFPAVFVLIYVVQTAFSLPGAAILSLAAGAIFGVLQGTLFVVSGATVGAVLAFLVSRTLLRDWVVRKFGGRMEGIDRGLRENGLSYLLFLRLVPAFPFFLVNLACGITGLPLRTYALGTLFGIMPGSLVFVNAGASLAAIETVRQVASPRVLGSFALLGMFALLPTIVKIVKKRREGKTLPLDRSTSIPPDGGHKEGPCEKSS